MRYKDAHALGVYDSVFKYKTTFRFLVILHSHPFAPSRRHLLTYKVCVTPDHALAARDNQSFFPHAEQKSEFWGIGVLQCGQVRGDTSLCSPLFSRVSATPFPKLFTTRHVFLMPFPMSSPVSSATSSSFTGFSFFFSSDMLTALLANHHLIHSKPVTKYSGVKINNQGVAYRCTARILILAS